MELLIFWLGLAIAIGIWASKRGRWFVLAALFSPLLAGLFLVASRNLAIEHAAQESIAHTKQCPRCAERVQKEALICRFCGYEFEGHQAGPPEGAISASTVGPQLGHQGTIMKSKPEGKGRPGSMGTIVALVLIGFMIYSVSNNWEIVEPGMARSCLPPKNGDSMRSASICASRPSKVCSHSALRPIAWMLPTSISQAGSRS